MGCKEIRASEFLGVGDDRQMFPESKLAGRPKKGHTEAGDLEVPGGAAPW